jgi:hypothetical protein
MITWIYVKREDSVTNAIRLLQLCEKVFLFEIFMSIMCNLYCFVW